MKPRRRARTAIFQALFEADVAGHAIRLCLRRHLEQLDLSPTNQAFCERLALGVSERLSEVDDVLQEAAPEWPVGQLATVDRNILRLAIYELLYDDRETPPKVVINEAVELAKRFGSGSSRRFVNGVLGTVLERRHELLTAQGQVID